MIVRCSICKFVIDVPTRPDVVRVMDQHHRKWHPAVAPAYEWEHGERLEERNRRYAPRDDFGHLALPARKPEHPGGDEV